MAPTYRVEELLAVRGSVSESAVSLEKFADEDAIKRAELPHLSLNTPQVIQPPTFANSQLENPIAKQHVLRPSASASGVREKAGNIAPPTAPRLRSSANDLTSTPKFPAPAVNSFKRASPSPSIKKAKAERLLKEHGSPPGRRVTAGGRIVPTDWTWSGNHAPPYPYGRFVPFYAYQRPFECFLPGVQPLGDLPNGFVGYNPTGKLCQIVDGEMRELKDGQLFMAAPNVPFPIVNALSGKGFENGIARPESRSSAALASVSKFIDDAFLGLDKMPYEKQIQFLDGEMKKAKHDHNQIERKEVLQEHALHPNERETMVNMKRELVMKMDQIRRFKKSLEQLNPNSAVSRSAFRDFGQEQASVVPKPTATDAFNSHMLSTSHINDGFYHNPAAPLQPTAPANAQYLHGWPDFTVAESSIPVSTFAPEAPVFLPTADSSNDNGIRNVVYSRLSTSPVSPVGIKIKRSHAIAIKAPPEIENKTTSKSYLDPTSPTYEPAHVFVPPSPSPIDSPAPHPVTQHTWLNSTTDASDSSVSTTNFFPNDAAEHSQRKHTFSRPVNAPPGAELSAFSGQIHNTTPQKDWIRNAQIASQATSPERQGISKGTTVSPVETRMSSWTQDILPSLEPHSMRQSPEFSRTNGVSNFNSFNNGLAGASTHGTPLKPGSILEGKSEEWCQGYIHGRRSARDTPSEPDTSFEYKAGFYQGLAHREMKALSKHNTPERGMSHQSSAHSLRKRASNANLFNNASMNDSAVNLPSMVENRRGSIDYPYNHDAPQYTSSGTAAGMDVGATYAGRAAAVQSFPGLVNQANHGLNGTDRRLYAAPGKSHVAQRGFSESAASAIQTHIVPSISTDTAPFLWKDQRLREQQVSSTLQTSAPTARSGNQLGTTGRVTSSTYNNQRWYPDLKTVPFRNEPRMFDPVGTKRRPENVSHFDGATDDLAELEPNSFAQTASHTPVIAKATPSPAKDKPTAAEEAAQSAGGSPKKSNSSPSKTKEVRERVASTARRMLKGNEPQQAREDPSEMTPADKQRHRSQWRKRFQKMKKDDQEEVRKNRLERNKP